jgi:hypothetical protein
MHSAESGDAGAISPPARGKSGLQLGKRIQARNSQLFERAKPAGLAKSDFEEAVVTVLLAVEMSLLVC